MGGPYAPPSAAERMACVAPVLCLQPMTAGDARYDAGRRAGLLEAAGLVDAAATRASSAWAVVYLLALVDELQAKAGAP